MKQLELLPVLGGRVGLSYSTGGDVVELDVGWDSENGWAVELSLKEVAVLILALAGMSGSFVKIIDPGLVIDELIRQGKIREV